MFIGHFAVGFGTKKLAPRAPLALLMAAVAWADILWTIFLMAGWEHARIAPGDTKYTPFDLYDYPWSHSLLMLLAWGTALGGAYWLMRKSATGAWVVGGCVVSHWVLDWVTHRADMPLYPGGPKFGLGLWNSITGTMAVEIVMLAAGVGIYLTATRAKNWIGRYIAWAFVAMLLLVYVADRFGTPPENMHEVAQTGLIATMVIVGWAWWFDRNREFQSTPTN
jgi:membrane-bound metal-dependent hydrolase YbcI (DUF457 family)